MRKKRQKTITITLTLKEAVAAYRYLHWAAQIEWRSRGLSCLGKRRGLKDWERFGLCAIDGCDSSRPHGGAVKTSVGRASHKLHYALLGEPVITPCPDGEVGEQHDYPNAIVSWTDLHGHRDTGTSPNTLAEEE